MAAITAAQVAELRKQTGCGMMDCKKALQEVGGDMELAVELLRKKGMAKADKAAGRIAAEGVIIILCAQNAKSAVMLEVNCETDFVARDENFIAFVDAVSQLALTEQVADLNVLMEKEVAGKTIEQLRKELIAKIGENVNVRRVFFMQTSGTVGAYTHGNRIGVLVSMPEGDVDLAKDLAMHIAASKPMVIAPDQVDAELIAKEKEIFSAQALESGKPANIVEKMVEGRIRKFVNEISLTGQPFVKDPNVTVGDLLQQKHGVVDAFVRFELGEGIEKKQEDFAEEVMAQVRGK